METSATEALEHRYLSQAAPLSFTIYAKNLTVWLVAGPRLLAAL
jgi:hypothetical protein